MTKPGNSPGNFWTDEKLTLTVNFYSQGIPVKTIREIIGAKTDNLIVCKMWSLGVIWGGGIRRRDKEPEPIYKPKFFTGDRDERKSMRV
jgi:hypothetical protein